MMSELEFLIRAAAILYPIIIVTLVQQDKKIEVPALLFVATVLVLMTLSVTWGIMGFCK